MTVPMTRLDALPSSLAHAQAFVATRRSRYCAETSSIWLIHVAMSAPWSLAGPGSSSIVK
jgi:hypothetical protein